MQIHIHLAFPDHSAYDNECKSTTKHYIHTRTEQTERLQMLSDDLLDGAKAAADFIGVKPRAVYHLVENRSIPFIRKGNRLFFRKSELEAAFRSIAA